MENKVSNFLETNKIDLEGQFVVIGVSTGVDSMVLLGELIEASKIKNIKIVVAHINHQKREQSFIEEDFIKNYCDKNGLLCHVKRLDNSLFLNGNFQALAREYRYQFFKEIMKQYNSRYLFLGHHANDNIETIMMRLIRGSNLLGYSGMDSISKLDDYFVLRPFLNVLKNEIVEMAKIKKIKYYEDESNKEDTYTRNRIREDIVPLLFLENSRVDRQFEHFSEMIKNANRIVSGVINEFVTNHVDLNDNGLKFDRNKFLALDPFLQKEVLFSLTKNKLLSEANVDELLKLINSNKVNLLVNFKDNLTFVREYNYISLYFINLVIPKVKIVINGYGVYKIDEKREIIVSKKSNNNLTNLNALWYNSNMMPITIRSREDGDRIKLSSGTKKISDLLSDRKIGIIKREQSLVVLDKDENVLSVLGIEKSSILKSVIDADIIITLKEKV